MSCLTWLNVSALPYFDVCSDCAYHLIVDFNVHSYGPMLMLLSVTAHRLGSAGVAESSVASVKSVEERYMDIMGSLLFGEYHSSVLLYSVTYVVVDVTYMLVYGT